MTPENKNAGTSALPSRIDEMGFALLAFEILQACSRQNQRLRKQLLKGRIRRKVERNLLKELRTSISTRKNLV